jgi:ABC-type bacteriocin/lantibiotic exporter with double-glycine peptidase domain
VRRFVVQEGVQAIAAVTQLFAVLVLMFVYSWKLTLVFLITAPLYGGLMRFSSRRLRPTFAALEEAFGEYHSRQIDAIKGIETVKALGAERGLRRHMLRQFEALSQQLFRGDFTVMLYEGAIQLVTFLGLALFLWYGGLQVIDGAMTIGEFVAFNTLVALATGPVLDLLKTWDELQYSGVLLNRLGDVVDQEPEQGEDHTALRPVTTMQGHVRFRGVGFAFPGPVPAPVLDGVELDVPAGTNVAIVGRSGSGKTTLIKCMAGLLEPTEGAILYDGLDMRELDYRSLRRQIGFVLQENHLFDETIARNIAFADDEPDMERVMTAARIASAHAFIERLPLGYDTRVGESGLNLSGGQAQRIAIARAVYPDPPVLIFDEATSALDAESERAVKENMDSLLADRTSFVIAHRLSTIRDADMIVVLEKGTIAETGTHEELLERRGIYYYLTSQQLEL